MKLSVLVTCGPTREPLDPVRFISNRSTGTLGIELAKAFSVRGHKVVLAAGPIEIPQTLSPKIRVVRFETAQELHRLALKEFLKCDVLCMTAAVGDFRPAQISPGKIKRGRTALTLRLIPNPDILADLGKRKKPGQFLIGFSVETEKLLDQAAEKLKRKNLDLLVAQMVGRGRDPFGAVLLDTLIVSRHGREPLRGVSKPDLAKRLVRAAEARIDHTRSI